MKKGAMIRRTLIALAMGVLLMAGGSVAANAKAAGAAFSWDNAIVYFVITDRFLDGNPKNNNSYGRPKVDASGYDSGTFHGGDIAGLTKKITDGYFTTLGVNAIWLTAPYEQVHGFVGGGGTGDFAHYGYHGYYALDYTMMDRNMGTVEDMRKFVEAAHAKGIRVIMDVVLNHPGYHTIKDMHEYGFGEWQDEPAPISWKPDEEAGENWHSYHEQFMDYNSGAENWAKWWGSDWIRAGLPGYEAGGQDDLTQNMSYLPDFKTDEDATVKLPPVLVTKWKKEKGGDFNKYLVPAAASLRQDMKAPPAGYLIKWLAAWVEEFGIDGFRCDTAKHVDIERWKELKVAASAALEKWRAKNPGKPGADWKEPFWMTGEVWGQGVVKNDYYDNGFDSIINFSFVESLNRGSGPNDPAVLEKIYSTYAKAIVGEKGFNVLTYISSHDTILFDRKNLIPAGTALLLCPGAVQIYYGDESARPDGEEMSDIMQQTRSDMNWKTADKKVFEHFRKLNQFRLRNVAVAAGKHNKIKSSAGYAFSRVAGDNSIAAVIGATGDTEISVGDLWKDGVVVANAYDGKTATVTGGKVKFAAGANGVILVEAK